MPDERTRATPDQATEPPDEPAAPETLTLAGEFPGATDEQWRSLVSAVLAKSGVAEDADPIEALSYTTYDGIVIRPLYTADDADAHDWTPTAGPGAPPFVRGATADSAAATGWDVRARHADPDAARTKQAVLDDLERGATSLWLVLGEGGIAVDDLPTVLDGVYLDLAPIVLEAGADTVRAVRVAARAGARPRGGPRRADGQRRGRPDRRAGPHRRGRRPDRARDAGREDRRVARLPRRHRGRDRLPRRRGERRAGTRHRRRRGRGLPARADRRRAVGRRGAGRAGVPLRRHGRAVPVHRQAARRPPHLGPHRRAERRRRRPRRPAAARGHAAAR